MSCCNRGRAPSLRTLLRSAPLPPSLPQGQGESGDMLRYRGKEDLVLRGPFSDRIYRVGPSRRLVEVAPADELTLLRSGLFVRTDNGQ